jgi:hypothetical protein
MKIVDDFVGQWQLHAWRCLHVNLDIHEVIFAAIMAAFFLRPKCNSLVQ